MSDLTKLVPFDYKIGVELTFLPNESYDPKIHEDWEGGWWRRDNPWELMTNEYKELCKAAGMSKWEDIYCDPGCVEYPSPVFNTWADARSWYKAATALAEGLDLTPFHPKQEGGMGHVNVGPISPELRIKLFNDIMTRPYLTWIFATPNNSDSCQALGPMLSTMSMKTHSFWSSSRRRKNPHATKANPNAFKDLNTEFTLGVEHLAFERLKNYIVHERECPDNVVEFRCFDSAADWDMQAQHIAFVQAYLRMLDSKPYLPMPYSLPENQFHTMERSRLADHLMHLKLDYRRDMKRCIKEFRQLIELLELPWDEYSWYIHRNLRPAFRWGDRK